MPDNLMASIPALPFSLIRRAFALWIKILWIYRRYIYERKQRSTLLPWPRQ